MSGSQIQTERVEDLLLQLVTQIDQELPPRSVLAKASCVEEVVLDLLVDGQRYKLTRYHPPPTQSHVSLSPREKEIIRLVGEGMPNKAISDVLEISPWTVHAHLRRVFAKLGVSSRAEMVARALQEGLLKSYHLSSNLEEVGQFVDDRVLVR